MYEQNELNEAEQICRTVAEKLLSPEILKRKDVSKANLAKVAKMSRPTFYRHLQAMGLGQNGTPMSLEDRIDYIGENFTVESADELMTYALEKDFCHKKTDKRAYDNSNRLAKAKAHHVVI